MTSVIVCAEVSFSKNPHYLHCKSIDWFPYDKSLFPEKYSRTDPNVFPEIPSNKSLHYIGTSQFIYIANQLTGVRKAQVSTKSISEHTPHSIHRFISAKTVP